MPFPKFCSTKDSVRFFVWIIILIGLLFLSRPAIAGDPVGGVSGIHIYNVTETSFSVVWEVETPSTCDIKLYDSSKTALTKGTHYQTNSNSTELAQLRGLMQVDVTGLTQHTTYYVQTVTTETSGGAVFEFPAEADLIQLITEEENLESTPKFNGYLDLALYDQSGTQQTDGVVAIVEAAGARYPVSTVANSGFPSDSGLGYYSVNIELRELRYGNGYVDWVTEGSPYSDHAITIKCFGGAVPGEGIGQRVIETTYPAENVADDYYDCLSLLGITDLDGCMSNGWVNQITLFPNQPPGFDLEDFYSVDRTTLLTINFCATDPEGDSITFTLGGDVPTSPDMTMTTDANCATITWTPTSGGFYENIQVTASDGTSSKTEIFEVRVTQGAPITQAGVVSIAPTSGVVTTDDLVCTVDPDKILNPDPGDVGNEDILYQWYATSNTTTPVFEETNPTGDKYQSTLVGSTYTERDDSYYCKVTVSDTHGSADPVQTASVAIENSPPTAPTSVHITPVGPVQINETLTCTASGATDADGDDIQYKFVWTSGAKNVDSGYKGVGVTTDELPTSQMEKGDTWICTVTARDEQSAESATSTQSDNSVSVANSVPTAPGDVSITPSSPKTGDALTCTINTVSTDADGDTLEYYFLWTCTASSKSVQQGPYTGSAPIADTLTSGNTVKGEQWSCEVWANDGYVDSNHVSVDADNPIQNTAPTNLTVEVTPTDAYVDSNLVCTVTGPVDADVDDEVDTITYDYVWTNGTKDVPHNGKTGTSDTLNYTETAQGETWTCTVTASDGTATVDDTSDPVEIVNRAPDVTTDPDGDTQVWDEEVTNTLEISADDLDGDNVTIEIDTNYADPTDALVSDWLTFDNTVSPAVLTGTPPVDSSGVDFGFGGTVGILEFNFIITDDGTPNQRVEKMITVMIQPPVEVVDDFEYDASKPTLVANNWTRLQGTGTMSLLVDPKDPNNHYMKTTAKSTPTNNSQLGDIYMKTITDPDAFTNEYPRIRFFLKTQYLWYFDAYVRAKNAAGTETNYFLRYVPQAPGTPAYSVSGKYVTYKIGTEYIDPNGIEVVRNMDEDLFNATGYRYMYLKAIIVRGECNFLDSIVVSSGGPPPPPPKEVKNLTAQGSEDKVTLSWQIDANQTSSIAGYKIYMQVGSDPGKAPANLKATVGITATTYTATGLTNGTTYYFRATAFDNLLSPTESDGVVVSATPAVTIPLPPVNLKAESYNGGIKLTWKNDPNQHLDLAGYKVYFGNCPTSSCDGYVSEMVPASAADATGGFTHYINKDASGNPLEYEETYNFTVKAIDSAASPNLSSGVAVSITLAQPVSKLIDNFDVGYAAGDTLVKKGWYKLQGSGAFNRKAASVNYYLELKSNYTGNSTTNFIINKWLTNPTEFNNPIFSARIRSAGDFRIDLYVKGKDSKNYFLSYKGDKTTAAPGSIFDGIEQVRFIVNRLFWGGNADTWIEVERDLDADLQNAKGVGFDYVMGILLRGTMDIDDMELGQGVEDVLNLTARPKLTEVLLSWTVADPNSRDNTMLYIDTNLVDPNMDLTNITGTNDYQYNVTGLTTGRTYEFKIAQEKEGEESKGVSISATPMVFASKSFTFDDASALTAWTNDFGVPLTAPYSPGIQSNVMYLDPNGDYPDRYYVYADVSETGVTGMKCHIKTDTNFVIWVDMIDTIGLDIMVGFVPGGTPGQTLHFGRFAYYYLGSGYTDGEWKSMNINLDQVLKAIFPEYGTGYGTEEVSTIYFGGKIYVDDVMFY